jgi:hypothetical protein
VMAYLEDDDDDSVNAYIHIYNIRLWNVYCFILIQGNSWRNITVIPYKFVKTRYMNVTVRPDTSRN